MAFTLFMVSLGQPAWRDPLSSEDIVWPGYALALLGGEAMVILVSLSAALWFLSRRREAF